MTLSTSYIFGVLRFALNYGKKAYQYLAIASDSAANLGLVIINILQSDDDL
jgi:hypothetical protein